LSATRHCAALLVSAPASGQGKTTVTAALARHHRDRGRRVRVFKTGPDFLDPMILECATGAPVYQLDLWMGGEDHCRRLLHDAAGEADLILIEGVMGLYDGEPSSADLAARFGIPVLAVIDGSAMAQTFGALAHGLARYRDDVRVSAVFANRVAGERHYEMLAESMPEGLASFGWLPREATLALPERHLGIVQAGEIADLDARIARAAQALRSVPDSLPEEIPFVDAPDAAVPASVLEGVRVAVARDAAFSFIYRANLDVLRALGAELVFFSPLADRALPAADAVYLPGGYPELHLERLAANRSMKDSLRVHHDAGKPIVAECGGMLYLLDALTDARGSSADMVGLLPGSAAMQNQLANLGLHGVSLPEGVLRGHTFHYSKTDIRIKPVVSSESARPGGRGEPTYRLGRLHASYVHLYFPSNPDAVARLFTRHSPDNRTAGERHEAR